MVNILQYIQASAFGATEEILALSSDVSPLQKRSLRFEKRRDECGGGWYCPDGWHCVSMTRCAKNTSYAWTAVFGVLALLLIILWCLKRRRAADSQVPTQQAVVIATPDQTTYPQQTFAPPAGDPNLAYQTPPTYPAPGASPYPNPAAPYGAPAPYPPPGSSPYPEKPHEAYNPAGSPPAGYPPASGSYAYPAPGAPAPYPAPGTPLGYPAPAPYPQGEAASYAPPK
ncbi:hypothetical protein BGX34_002298 [Mortierella sp. NVP85]|nr:hypothetical protein BGX34_002298 [Mortierella sp. NVP85]